MRLTILVAALIVLAGAVFPSAPRAQATPCPASGGLNFICGMKNPEDLVQLPNTRWLVASGMAEGSGLHLIDTQAKTASNLYAVDVANARADRARFAGCPGPLDPKLANLHGLSLRPAPAGRYTLYATNHGGRESIEVFEVDAAGASPTATWIGCVLMPEQLAANSVAAFGDGTLLATVPRLAGRTFEEAMAGQNTGAVFQWKPGSSAFQLVPGTELPGNNGIDTSPDDREFYVVSPGLKRIVAFSRASPAGARRFVQFKDFSPDNVRWTSDNLLITAGMIDDEPACGPARTRAAILCPRGWVAATIDPKTMSSREIARGPANPAYTGTAIAMRVGGELWLSSFNGDRVAYRALAR